MAEHRPGAGNGAPLAILGALPEELRALAPHVQQRRDVRHGGVDVRCGVLAGHKVVMALSGIGTVAAASAATWLIARHAPFALLFTGVAGGLADGVQVGHVVVADALLQHDLDASPLFPRYEIPGLGLARIASDATWSARLAQAAADSGHVVHRGLVISGDRFVASAAESRALRDALPDALAVEMEGAAVAQVCHRCGVPFAVMRTISDRADDAAHVDFARFVAEVACDVTHDAVLGALAAVQ